MSFVQGYPRDLGWVKAHRRRPNRAESGQLPLIAPVPVDPPTDVPTTPPAPREVITIGTDGDGSR